MTIQNRTTLKSFFNTGDIPTESQYADVMDSFVNLSETGSQILQSPLRAPSIGAVAVVSAAAFEGSSASITGTVSANTFAGNTFTGTTINGTTINSTTINATTVSTATVRAVTVSVTSLYPATVINTLTDNITAIGTTAASAASLGGTTLVVVKTASGSENSVIYNSLPLGRQLIIINDTNSSVQVFPPNATAFNSLSPSASYEMPASTMAMIISITSTQAYIKRFTG